MKWAFISLQVKFAFENFLDKILKKMHKIFPLSRLIFISFLEEQNRQLNNKNINQYKTACVRSNIDLINFCSDLNRKC